VEFRIVEDCCGVRPPGLKIAVLHDYLDTSQDNNLLKLVHA